MSAEGLRRQDLARRLGLKVPGPEWEAANIDCACNLEKSWTSVQGGHEPFCNKVLAGVPGYEGLGHIFDHTTSLQIIGGTSSKKAKLFITEPYMGYETAARVLPLLGVVLGAAGWDVFLGRSDPGLAVWNPGSCTPIFFINNDWPHNDVRVRLQKLGAVPMDPRTA